VVSATIVTLMQLWSVGQFNHGQ